MKKVTSLLLAIILVFSIVACNGGQYAAQNYVAKTQTNTVKKITTDQQDAAKIAKDYLNLLDITPFSRHALIGLLMDEGFSSEEAEYGADSLEIDWNEQAARSAKDHLQINNFSRQELIDQLMDEGFSSDEAEYGADEAKKTVKKITIDMQDAAEIAKDYIKLLDITPFSRQVLINQLMDDGFTLEEAEYGADSLEIDWNEQAARSAKDHLQINNFSRQKLIDQLMDEGFSSEEAKYGVNEAKNTTIKKITKEQQNVAKAAKFILDEHPASRQTIIDILRGEGFTLNEVEVGVDSLERDWNEQAARQAQRILEQSPYSKELLIEHLVEIFKFTPEQAELGVDSLEIDWKEQAARWVLECLNEHLDTPPDSDLEFSARLMGFSAGETKHGITVAKVAAEVAKEVQLLLDDMPASRQTLIDVLVKDGGYSHDAAVCGVDSLNVDWNEQAARAVQLLLDENPNSRQTLIDVLVEPGGYSREEEESGVDSLNVDWNEQAAKQAQMTLDEVPGSRKTLIDVLVEPGGYSREEAESGVDSLNVDWNEQVARFVQEFLVPEFSDEMPAPRHLVIYTLVEPGGFTLEQAKYGVDSLEADWNEQAARLAKNLLDEEPYSRQALIDGLVNKGFSYDEAESGIDSLEIDWIEQAGRATILMLDELGFSIPRHLIIAFLEDAGFTPEQAEYGADESMRPHLH